MLGGRFFDNIWDPYSAAYAYPRPRYYRPREDHYEVPEDRSNEQPVNKKTAKKVKTIPVTDGGAPDLKPPVAKSEDAAATEIQAFYRGYVVRKTQPLKHLKLIRKVKEELEILKFKLQEAEQKTKLRSDSKERLRWTEGVMALLLRLDSLQGVHPEVRLIRKAVTKELIGFQETIDSMSSVSTESNDAVSHETSGSSAAPAPEVEEEMEIEDSILRVVEQDFASGGASDNGSDGLGVNSSEDLSSEKHVPHALLASNDHVNDSVAPHCDDNVLHASETIVEVGGSSASETVPDDAMDAENKEHLLAMSPTHHMEEGEIEPASSPSLPPETGSQDAEVDMSQSDVDGDNPTFLEEKETTGLEGRIIPARISTQSIALEPRCDQDDKQDNVNALSGHSLILQELEEPRNQDAEADMSQSGQNGDIPTLLEEKETTGLDGCMIPERISTQSMTLEPQCKQDDKHDNVNALPDRSLILQELEENRNLDAEVDMSQSGVNGDNPTLLKEETTGLDDRIIPARISTQSMALEPRREQDDKQDNVNALPDRSLLLQVLEENRKLKDVLGKVLEWGKQQSDAIHNLTHRIAQLEEHQPPSNLLHWKDRKRVRSVDNMERSRRRLEKGRRNRRHRGYVDSEDWPSVESDDYF